MRLPLVLHFLLLLPLSVPLHSSFIIPLCLPFPPADTSHRVFVDGLHAKHKQDLIAAVGAAVAAESRKLENMVQLAVDQAEVMHRHNIKAAVVACVPPCPPSLCVATDPL